MGTRNREKFGDHRLRFITTTCHEWLHLFNEESDFSILAASLQFVNDKHKAEILAYVFMPNHIHLIVLFENGESISPYMHDFKRFTSVAIRKKMDLEGRHELLEKIKVDSKEQKFKVWQDRFDDLYIRDIKALQIKMNYMHENPVRRGLAEANSDYKYSSAGYYEKEEQGFMPVTHYLEAMGYANHYYYGRVF